MATEDKSPDKHPEY